MYLLVNRNNGNLAHLPLDGIIHQLNRDGLNIDGVADALGTMRIGEYTHIMMYTIVRSTAGVPFEELKAKATKNCPVCNNTRKIPGGPFFPTVPCSSCR
jgi:hypothetical protein